MTNQIVIKKLIKKAVAGYKLYTAGLCENHSCEN